MKGSTIRAILCDTSLTEGARIVLLAIASRADRDGLCWPSNGQIGDDCGGMPDRTVRRHLAEIVAAGRITTRYDRAAHRRYITFVFAHYATPEHRPPVAGGEHRPNGESTGQMAHEHRPPVAEAPATSGQEHRPLVATPTKNAPLNGPLNNPHEGAGVCGGRDLETVEQATDGEVRSAARPPRAYPKDEVDRVVDAVHAMDPNGLSGNWSSFARQMIGQYPPAWVLEAFQAALAKEIGETTFVLGALRRYDRQGMSDDEKARKRGGYRRPDGPPPGLKFSQIPSHVPDWQPAPYVPPTPEEEAKRAEALSQLKASLGRSLRAKGVAS